MNISGIKFDLALTLGPIRKNGNVGYSVHSSSCPKEKTGVYVVIQGDKNIVYIGTYQTGVIKRWGWTKRNDIYHFKKGDIHQYLSKRHRVRVFAQDEQNIKRKIGHPKNKWINCHSIESWLITAHKPIWNKRGNRRQA